MKSKMKKFTLLIFASIVLSLDLFAQGKWTISNVPASLGRIEDLFMIDAQTGYAACGSGQIFKTSDGGNNWLTIYNNSVTNRSIEFINSQKGFVGALDYSQPSFDILMRTLDGGSSWTDVTLLIMKFRE